MDKEQARLVLASFRPDGADARDGDFAAALALAAEDRELGEWLARERALDSEFARALARAEISEDLREAILLGMRVPGQGVPPAHEPLDAMFIGALASVQPPLRLRADLLTAMNLSAAVAAPAPANIVRLRRWMMPAAAAALVVLGAWLAIKSPLAPAGAPSVAVLEPRISADMITRVSIRTLEAPDARMEIVTDARTEIDAWLALRELPAPLVLPTGLREVPCLGCRTIVVDGYRGSMVCFASDSGPMHLVVFDRPCVAGTIPRTPVVTQENGWTVAKWCDGKRAYILLSRADIERVGGLF